MIFPSRLEHYCWGRRSGADKWKWGVEESGDTMRSLKLTLHNSDMMNMTAKQTAVQLLTSAYKWPTVILRAFLWFKHLLTTQHKHCIIYIRWTLNDHTTILPTVCVFIVWCVLAEESLSLTCIRWVFSCKDRMSDTFTVKVAEMSLHELRTIPQF